MSFQNRMLTDEAFRAEVEGDAVARMNPERTPDGDWGDRVDALRAHANAIEAGDRRGAKLLREAATSIAFLSTRLDVLDERLAVAVAGMTRAKGERDHARRLYCRAAEEEFQGKTAEAIARLLGWDCFNKGER